MGFKALEQTVYNLLNDKIYEVPKNQRKYVWKKNNWEELFSDLHYNVNRPEKNHFIGSIVLKAERKINNIERFSIIDGQQRIVTLTILVVSILFLFKNNDLLDDFDGATKHILVIDSKNNKLPIIEKNSNKYIAELIEKVLAYRDSNEVLSPLEFIKTINTQKNILKECFLYFTDKLIEYSKDNTKFLIDIKDIVTRINYISISATSDEDSYIIFEILNARGLDLDDSELVKNFVLRYSNNEDEKLLIEKHWLAIESILKDKFDTFIKHYVTHRYGEKSDKDENRPYKIINRKEKDSSMIQLMNDLLKKSSFYHKIIEPTNDTVNQVEYKVFNFLRKRRQQQFRPLFLGLMNQYSNEKLTYDEYNENILYLANFFICYNIIGDENSNKLEDVVYKYSKIIENDFSPKNLLEFKKSIAKRVPSKDWFVDQVKNVGYSSGHLTMFTGSKNSDRVKVILELIESFKSGFEFDDDVTVEHIFSDSNRFETCTIGNLLPLEEDLNKLAKNKSVTEKAVIYKTSKYPMTKEFGNKILAESLPEDQLNFIKKRTTELAEFIYDQVLKFS
jgi:hypothetical protein